MTSNQLAECLEQHLTRLNDIDDAIAVSSAECSYGNYEEFVSNMDMELFEQDWRGVLRELKKRSETLLISGEKCDVRDIFEESTVAINKFNVFLWNFMEIGKKSEASEQEVELAVLAASIYVAICGLHGANCSFFQVGLLELALKIARNCCSTMRIGDIGGGTKKSIKSVEKEPEVALGPPRIPLDSAERYILQLSTQFYAFLKSDNFSLDPAILMSTMEWIEELGRLDLDARTCSRSWRALSVQEFRSLDRITDRYCSLIHVLCESKYKTRAELVYGRIIRPRLAFVPFPDEGMKSSKITVERKRAGELVMHLICSRIELCSSHAPSELKLIQTILGMMYLQCPDYAEYRTSGAQFIVKILEKMPYKYAYDFVQLMHLVFHSHKGGGARALSIELSNVLLGSFDFSEPDPGALEENQDEEHPEEQDEEAEHPDKSDDEENDSEEEDNEKNEPKKSKKSPKTTKNEQKIQRKDAHFVLFNIIYLACLDKNGAIRMHGATSLTKILEHTEQRENFQKICEKINKSMDERLGEIGEHHEEQQDALQEKEHKGKEQKSKAVDLLLGEQRIIEKYNKLKMMNKGETRTEQDAIFMLVRRISTDDKAPVKRAGAQLLRLFLSFTRDKEKFEKALLDVQRMCRDKQVSVRKSAAEAITMLMHQENIPFKELLSSKWLHSLITQLNDTDNDITAHARKMIMEVLSPLLREPTELTWALLDNIESVTNHRQYLMSTLKDAVREKRVEKSVVERMKEHILCSASSSEGSSGARGAGAWMVFSQLCVQFQIHVDFAIEQFENSDLSKQNPFIQYMTHIIENNIEKIGIQEKKELENSMKRTLSNYCLHSSHVRSVYHCLAKLMDGIGDRATNGPAFREFANEQLVKCFDTIVESMDLLKRKEQWKVLGEQQEQLLCVALTIASEVVSFSPQLIPGHERLAKTLSMIVNAHSEEHSDINPDIPLGTRPPTQMSSQGGNQGNNDGEMLFSEPVRAVSVITLSNMILAYDRLLKLMPMLVKQLQSNSSHQIRSNIVVALGDICASYKTDRYAPVLAASLCDPSVLVRRHAINQIARLISFGIFRFTGEIMIRTMLATLDANEDVRNDAKLYISECMQAEDRDFFQKNFVQYMLALTQAKRLAGTSHDEEDRHQVDIAIGGGDPLARPSRIAIYTFMIESLGDRARYDVKTSISLRIFRAIVNGEYDFSDFSTQCLLDDALLIMASKEMQVKFSVGENPNENALEDPSPELVDAATGVLSSAYLEQYMKTIVPAILELREFLNQHRSPLQRKCLHAIRMICMEHKDSVDRILGENRQLKDEINFELKRMQQRSEQANRILDEYLRKVAEFHKEQRALQEGSEGSEALQDGGAEPMSTPPRRVEPPTPQTRPLSPKTLKKIRRSVGALITNGNNEMRLAPPNLEDDTHMEEVPNAPNGAPGGSGEIQDAKNRIQDAPSAQNGAPGALQDPEELPDALSAQNGHSDAPSAPRDSGEIQDAPSAQNGAPEDSGEIQGAPNEIQNGSGEIQDAPGAQQDSEELPDAQNGTQNAPEDAPRAPEPRARRRKTPNRDPTDESIDSDGQVWKKPKIAPKSPESVADTSMNVTQRRNSRRIASSSSTISSEISEKPKRNNKRKAIDEEEEGAEPQEYQDEEPKNSENQFDTTKLGAGRQCSTPISRRSEEDIQDVTFALNLSAITEKEDQKYRRSHAQILRQICEESEDDDEEHRN